MQRSRSVVLTAAAVALTVVPLAGCSLFRSDRAASQMPGGSPSAQVTVSATTPPSTAPSTSASLAPVAPPTPLPVAGYTLAASPPAFVRKFEDVAGRFNGVFGGLTVRNVSKGTTVTGTLVLLGLRPQLIGNANIEGGLLPGVVKGMTGQGAKTSNQKIGNVDVAVASTKTTSIVAWYAKGTVVLVMGNGTDPAPTLAFAKAYLATAGA